MQDNPNSQMGMRLGEMFNVPYRNLLGDPRTSLGPFGKLVFAVIRRFGKLSVFFLFIFNGNPQNIRLTHPYSSRAVEIRLVAVNAE